MSFLQQVEEIVCQSLNPVAKASAIWMHTMGRDRPHYETALYLFQKQASKGFYDSPEERFQELLRRSRIGDTAAQREAIQILIECLEV